MQQCNLGTVAVLALVIGVAMSYLTALRLFTVTRTDMTGPQTALLFAAAPIAALWRAVLLRPVYWYAMATCTRISRWGTRDGIEVRL